MGGGPGGALGQAREHPGTKHQGSRLRARALIAASRKVLEASFRRRDHHSSSPAQPCRAVWAWHTHGCCGLRCAPCAVLRLGGGRGGAQTLSDTTHYRTRIKGQGPDNIKVETKQFDRATMARCGDDHNAASRWRRKATLEVWRASELTGRWEFGNWLGARSLSLSPSLDVPCACGTSRLETATAPGSSSQYWLEAFIAPKNASLSTRNISNIDA